MSCGPARGPVCSEMYAEEEICFHAIQADDTLNSIHPTPLQTSTPTAALLKRTSSFGQHSGTKQVRQQPGYKDSSPHFS